MAYHEPVMLAEVREAMQPRSGGVYVDATLGHGGHTAMLLEASAPNGRVIGIERDVRNLESARERLGHDARVTFVHRDYRSLAKILDEQGIHAVDGILLDVGFSSAHVDDASRGFSFQQEGPLDMRYDQSQPLTAATIVNTWPEDELTRIFLVYGEEPKARHITRAILERRATQPFATTTDLANVVAAALGRRGKLHPATRAFQALRIVVNGELDALEAVLPQAAASLKPGGRLCVITFHSLEDRIVKRFLRAQTELSPLTKRPVVPTATEAVQNPRARSAKLRAAQKQNTNDPYARSLVHGAHATSGTRSRIGSRVEHRVLRGDALVRCRLRASDVFRNHAGLRHA